MKNNLIEGAWLRWWSTSSYTFGHDELKDAFQAGWKAAKEAEGYHTYTPPQNTLKEYCTKCHESLENGKHLSEEVKLGS